MIFETKVFNVRVQSRTIFDVGRIMFGFLRIICGIWGDYLLLRQIYPIYSISTPIPRKKYPNDFQQYASNVRIFSRMIFTRLGKKVRRGSDGLRKRGGFVRCSKFLRKIFLAEISLFTRIFFIPPPSTPHLPQSPKFQRIPPFRKLVVSPHIRMKRFYPCHSDTRRRLIIEI